MPRAVDQAKAATIGEAASQAQYEVLRAGREKVQQSAPRWRRVTDGNPCGFCAMVCSRGPAYRSADAAGQGRRYHGHCGCTVEPFYGDPKTWVPTPDEARFIQAYDAAWKPGIKTRDLSDDIGAWLAGNPAGSIEVRFGRTLDAADGSTKPLKGHGPGRPLTPDEYNNAPSSLTDYEYHYIADPDDRATAILQYNCDTEQWAKTAARNIKAGRDPFDGIDLEAPQEEGFLGDTLADAHLRGDRYTLTDLRADLEGTARKLVEWESKTEDLGTAYKGMNFDMDMSWDEVRALLDFRGLSYNSVASDLNTASLYAGRADRSRSVYVHFEDATGIRLDSVGGHASKTESLVTGDFEIVSTRIEPDGIGYGDVMIVNVRRTA